MDSTSCPKCGGAVVAGEAFCAGCGYALQSRPGDLRKIAEKIQIKQEKQSYQGKIRSGRRTILACAILFTIGTVLIWGLMESKLTEQRQEISKYRGNPMYDQDKVKEADQKLNEAAGTMKLATGAQALMALAYYGLWWWAKARPLPATLSALILFIAVQMLNLAFDPALLLQGILIKVLILAALIGAVNAAQKYQKMTQQGV
ncbi:MAG TPA: hypothetical protein VEN81_14180 [Planctomycetota bacterium]|nr:hypothetical protein [Planctomycetota bacterium]